MSSPKFARAFNAAVAASERGDLKTARKHLTKALKEAPRHAGALHHLGLICQQTGDIEASARYLRRAVAADPGDPIAFNNLGNVLLSHGDAEAAAEAYRQAIALRPDYVNALFNRAKLLVRLGDLKEGIEIWRRVYELAPGDLEVCNELGVALMRDNKHEEAASMFRSALAIDPDHTESHNSLGVYFMHMGEMDSARACFQDVLTRDPNHARAHENLARSRRFTANDQATISHLERLIEDEAISDEDRMLLHFSLGKIYDDCRESEKAFHHYSKGNALKRRTSLFDAAVHSDWVNRVIDTFTADFFSTRKNYGTESDVPVFIVGMIRSGTTLVEQIVASHPAVAGGGELLHISDISRGLSRQVNNGLEFPECARDLSAARVRELGDHYVRLLREHDSRALRVTDKLPTNFLYLGLISLMLPRARVIHCIRNPLDVAVSIYFQRFADGHEYSYSLEDIAAYYHEYVRLMTHWKRSLTHPIHEVRYETLISDQESESRKLIEYCGLEWDPACLQFEKTHRMISTASNWQVRQPVYRSSVEKWRRYEAHLEPIRRVIDDVQLEAKPPDDSSR